MKTRTKFFLGLSGSVLLAVAVVGLLNSGPEKTAANTRASTPSTGVLAATTPDGKSVHDKNNSANSTVSKEVPAALPVKSVTDPLPRAPISTVDALPAAKEQNVNPERPGEAAVDVKGTVYHLMPNQLGNYQKVNIEPNAKITARVSFQGGEAGDSVMAEVEDGGGLSGKDIGKVLQLDAQKTAKIEFQASDQEGIYRILLRKGADVRVINLWVGKPLTYHD